MATNENDYALVIGINDYPSFRGLKGALEDARDFAAWLVDTEIGGGVQGRKCRTVCSTENPLRPIQNDIDDELLALFRIAREAGGGRRFYFYFSGHGLSHSKFSTNLCLPFWSEEKRNSSLDSQNYLKVVLDSGFFDEVVVLMDCCRVRKVNAQALPCTLGFSKPADDAGKTKTFIANASEVFNAAYEATVESAAGGAPTIRGHFTRALLEALRGGAALGTGGVTASDLKAHLERETPRIAREHNHQQQSEVDNGLPSDPEPIFGSALPPDPKKRAKVTIRFAVGRKGEIVLEGPDLTVIRRGSAERGPWKVDLGSGHHMLIHEPTGDERSLKVRPGVEALDVEF